MRIASQFGLWLVGLLVTLLTVSALQIVVLPAALAGPGSLPEQRQGSAAGRGHTATTDETSVDRTLRRGGAKPAGRGLAKDKRLVRQPAPGSANGTAGFQVADEVPAADPVKGFEAATSKPLPEQSRADKQVFANADGTTTVRHFTGRQMYDDGKGGWHRVDSTLKPAAEGGWEVAADSLEKSFAQRADAARVATVELADGASVGFGIDGAAGVTGVAQGNGVRYRGVRPGADIEIEANPLGVKETIVLQGPDAPTVWDFPLHLEGVVARLAGRAVELVDAQGEVVGIIPPGFMVDSNKDPRTDEAPRSDDVEYELVGTGSAMTLRVSVDEEWLHAQERKFPVFVDPSVTTIESNGDTYVMYPFTNNYSAETQLKVGTYDGGAHKAVSLLRFNVSSLNNHKILGASLGLYSIWSYSCSARNVVIRPLTESWTVNSNKTWPGPSWGAEIDSKSFAAGYSSSCGPKWVTFDVTGRIDKWTHGTANYGLRVGASGTDSYAWKKFASANSANAPYLDITYNKYWATYSGITQVKSVTATSDGSIRVTSKNLGAETWTPTTYQLGYRLWDTSTNPDTELGYPTYTNRKAVTSNVAHGSSLTMDMPIKKLAPGSYRLQFDMVKTGVTRFSNTGVPMSANVTFAISSAKPVVSSWSPASGFQSDSLTPTLTVTVTDPDNYPAASNRKHQFRICAPDGTACTLSTWMAASSWTVPAGTLEWGKQYIWQARADDGDNIGDWSGELQIATRVPQPAITSHLGGADGGGLDPAVGNFTVEATDAELDAVGPRLAVDRTYNTQDPRTDLAFGPGWSTPWDTGLSPDADGSGNVVVTFADGRQGRFGKQPDGSYATPPGERGTLVADAAGGWTLRDVGDVRYKFAADGSLKSIRDAAGHVQSLTHDTSGRLTRAADDISGRYLDFTWTDGRVTGVTQGPLPLLTWTYQYTAGNLTKACDPRTLCTTYAYTASPQFRSAMVDANPAGYWRLAEHGTSTPATSEIPGIWSDTNGTHTSTTAGSAGPVSGSGLNATAFNGTSSQVKLPAGIATGRAHLGVEMWFRTTANGGLFGAQNWVLGQTAGTSSVPLLYVGADGKLRGAFPTADDGVITSTGAVNDGTWHHVALSASGTTQTMYLDGAPVGTLSGQVVWNGEREFQIGAAWTTGAASAPATGASHFNGEIAEVALHHRPLNADLVAEHHAAAAATQKLDTMTEAAHTSPTINLDYSPVTERVSSHADANGGLWKLGAPSTTNTGTAALPDWRTSVTVTDPAGDDATYVYDPTRGGQLMSLTDAGGGTTSYEYDTGGFPFTVTDPNNHVIELRHDARGNEISRTQCRTGTTGCFTSYNSYFLNPTDPLDPRNDQVTEARDARSASAADDTYLTRFDYYPNGELKSVAVPGATGGAERITTHVYTDGTEPAIGGGATPAWLLESVEDPGGGVTKFGYNSRGDLVQETDPVGLITDYGYDQLGRMTSQTLVDGTSTAKTSWTWNNSSWVSTETAPAVTNPVSGTVSQERTVYGYRGDGQLVSQTVQDLKAPAGTTDRKTSYGYDSFGRRTVVTDPEGGVTRTAWDDFGQPSSVTDAEGTVWTYSYTPGKRQLATTTMDEWTGGTAAETNMVVESRAYDPAGRVASRTDAMGNTIDYAYYDDGLLASETLTSYLDPESNTTRPVLLASYDYAGNGTVRSATRGEGRYEMVTAYDPGGRPVTVTELDGEDQLRSTTSTYGPLDQPTDVIVRGPAGGTLAHSTMAYDAMGRETRRVDHLTGTETAVTTKVLNKRGLPLAVTDPRGNATGANPDAHTTNLTWDERGRQSSLTTPSVSVEADGAAAVAQRIVTRFGYDAFGSLTHLDAPGGLTTRTYDKLGREASVTLPEYTPAGASSPLVATTRRGYDALGRVTELTRPSGAVTAFAYDELGNVVRRTDPAPDATTPAPVTTTAYTRTGLPLTVIDPTGAQTHSTWDELGRQETSTVTERKPTVAHLTTTYRYDRLGNPSAMISPAGVVTAFRHDDQGNPVEMTRPDGVTVAADFDALGRPIRVADPTRSTLEFDYDLGGRNTAIRDLGPAGGVLRTRDMTWDVAGNLLTETDGAGGLTTRTWDALGQLRSEAQKVTATKELTTRFGYDATGAVSRVTDPRGDKTIYTTMPWGLPESVVEPSTAQHPDIADRTYTSVYDVDGHLVETRAPGGVVTTRVYDAAGRLTGQAGAGAEAATAARGFAYDAAGRMTTAQAGARTTSFTLNDRGLPLNVSGTGGGTTYTWDEDGRPTKIGTAAGATAYAWDPVSGKLTSVGDPLTGTSASYGYDSVGRVSTVDYGATARTMAYDNFGRLASETSTAGAATTASISYGYDLADRMTSKTVMGLAGAATNTYGYDFAGRLTSHDDGTSTTTYGWDDAGNLTQRGAVTATFNARNQLQDADGVSYTWSPRGTLASRTAVGQTTALKYDAFGQLIADGTRDNAYDGLGRLATAEGKTMTYVGGSLKAAGDGTRRYTYDPAGEVLGVSGTDLAAQTAGATLGWADLHTDLVATIDPATGALAGSRSFSPWGEETAASGAQPGIGFQSQFTDPVTGNVAMGARWYQPATGTFASRDAASFDARDLSNANRYAYAGANPLTQTDPEGYFWGSIKKAASKVAKVTVSVAKEVSGYNDIKGCIGGSWSSCAWAAAGIVPVGRVAKYVAKGVSKAVKSTRAGSSFASSTARSVSKVSSATRSVTRAASKTVSRYGNVGHYAASAVRYAGSHAASAGGRSLAASSARAAAAAAAAREAARVAAQKALIKKRAMTPAAKPPRSPSISPSVQACLDEAAKAQPTIDLGVVGGGTTMVDEAAASAMAHVDDFAQALPSFAMQAGGAVPQLRGLADDISAAGARSCSFTGDTTVTLGDGIGRKRIEDIEVGEKVLATDPATGEASPREVRQVFAHADTVVDLHLADGSVIATTEDHPFWSVSDQRFERADELEPGELVRGADGRVLEVAELALDSARRAMAYNLAVEGIHTFHVGDAKILVHNTCSRKLGKALASAGFTRLPGEHAHHIVPGTHKLAADAQNKLKEFGIDIDSADNGVFLPGYAKSPNPHGKTEHLGYTNTHDYIDKVNHLLGTAGSRDDAIVILNDIRSTLLGGGRL